MNRTISYR